jgi:geranylgeranyl pyrophosphate synthase
LLGKIVKTNDPEKLGYDLGIIAGDIVYALAIDAFLSIKEAPERKERALKYFIQTAAFTAMGEFIDTVHGVEKLNKITEKDVFLNYTLKTARYTFDCPLVIGAILAGAPEKDIQHLSDLGILIGQAFQIQDDIIGIFDTQKNIGKSILSDLVESKKTILVCHANKNLKGTAKTQFTQIFNKPRKNYQDLVAIRKIFIQSGSLRYSVKAVEDRLAKALQTLDNLSMQQPYKNIIRDATLKLFQQTQTLVDQNKINSSAG